ncbi:hypothetical protein BDB00DRAFT_873104 [Zychaea mexicana]|uniref:uncharacterized protein n=1 Tax=Zychaea mexicana TaxID=64656 RepID=UPI0022FEE000|nr:uncharacterized protein BDB00DRAFT_873104 [Zychaea mexicana]KAI9492704.1 hypothetical protein BDB00DRAFT_873104 [Zychaea mexicana]
MTAIVRNYQYISPPLPSSQEDNRRQNTLERTDENGLHSTLFIIPKKTGGLRSILNLRLLNLQHLQKNRSFTMETISHVCRMIQANGLLASIDLEIATPSLVWIKVLRPVLRWARRRGIRISAYLDDILIAAKSSAQAFHIDTKIMQFSVPPTKLRDLRREARRLLNRPTTSVRLLSSFIGKAQAARLAVLPAGFYTRQAIAWRNRMLASGFTWGLQIQLSASVCMAGASMVGRTSTALERAEFFPFYSPHASLHEFIRSGMGPDFQQQVDHRV